MVALSNYMSFLWHDVVHGLRSLIKSPTYAALSVLTLALGIGANTAIFSVVNGVLLKPLGYPHPEQLEFIASTFAKLNLDRFWLSLPEWAELKERNRSFQDVGGYRTGAVNLGTTDRPRRVNSMVVTPELMAVLGIAPLRGRWFTADDSRPGAEAVAILAYSTWHTDFGGDDALPGKSVIINGVSTRVVGIMPPGYDVHDERIEIYQPLTINPQTFPNSRGGHFLYLIGRRKDGVSPQAARADIDRLVDEWPALAGAQQHAPTRAGNFIHLVQVEPLRTDLVGAVGKALWVLQGAVGFVLLIACANLANLILARSESRQKEFAVRAALGASRWRLLRQFLTEGVMLALAGGALGAAVGFAGLRALLAANPESIPRALEITLDWRVLAFTFAVSVATGLLFGMAPLLHLRESAMSITLKESTRSTTGSARGRLRGSLVMAEVALAVVLVIGAGLLLRSFQKLMTADPGFRREHLTTFGIVLPTSTYQSPESRVAFFDRLLDRLRQVPGVIETATMTGLPPLREVNANDTTFEGYMPTPDTPAANVDYYQTVSVDYLKTMGIPIVKGRGFERTDIAGAPVVLVNEALEKTFYAFRNLEAVGHRIRLNFGPGLPPMTIAGVVRDVKQGGISKKTGTELYFLYEQGPRLIKFAPNNMNVVLRSTLSTTVLAQVIQQSVQTEDPLLPVVKLRSMDQVFADSASRPRFLAVLLAIFAGLALALAAIGTYGILSYSVTERTKEIGIHMALGATRGSVLGMILGQGMRLTVVGLVAGLAASFALTRLLQAQLYVVKPTDPVTLVVVAAFFGLVALIACYIPAQRATRVDPMNTLREG